MMSDNPQELSTDRLLPPELKMELSMLLAVRGLHRRTRREGWGGCSPPNFERNYHFRAIPIEIFGQFVGLSINFRSSK